MLSFVQVFGTFIIEHSDVRDRTTLLDMTYSLVAKDIEHLPSSRLLVHPPFDSAMHTSGYGLARAKEDYWKEHFFKKEYTGGEVQVAEFHCNAYNPLARTYCVIQMTWTYDTAVQMSE